MVGWVCVDMASRHGSPCPISSSSSMGRPLSCTESETLFRMQDHELLRMPLPGGRVPIVVDERPCTGRVSPRLNLPPPLVSPPRRDIRERTAEMRSSTGESPLASADASRLLGVCVGEWRGNKYRHTSVVSRVR